MTLTWEDDAMHITWLTVPDCPNAPVIEERITRALDGRSANVKLVEVADQEQATRLGMTGSPTVLIDGSDPFAAPGAPASLSCRLYPGPGGKAEGAPSVAELQRALDVTETTRDCPGPLADDAVGRGGQSPPKSSTPPQAHRPADRPPRSHRRLRRTPVRTRRTATDHLDRGQRRRMPTVTLTTARPHNDSRSVRFA